MFIQYFIYTHFRLQNNNSWLVTKILRKTVLGHPRQYPMHNDIFNYLLLCSHFLTFRVITIILFVTII